MLHRVESMVCLRIRPVIPQPDGRDLNDTLRLIERKKDAILAYAFPVSPLPLPPFERDDIAPQRIILHLPQPLADESLIVVGKASKLSCGVV